MGNEEDHLQSIHECPDCASENIIHSTMRDQVICKDCGLVFEPFMPVERPVTAKAREAPARKAKPAKKPKARKAKAKLAKKAKARKAKPAKKSRAKAKPAKKAKKKTKSKKKKFGWW